MSASSVLQWRMLAWVMASLAPHVSAAQNRVLNGDFDATLAGWRTSTSDGRSATWNNDDAQSNTMSGSVELRHAGAPTGFPALVLQQCVSLSGMPTGLTPFGVRSKALQEGAGSVQAQVALAFYRDHGCTDLLSLGPTYTLAQNSADWLSENTSFNRSANANSLLIELGLSRSIGSGVAGAVRFDAVYVGAAGAGPAQVEVRRWTVDAGGGLTHAGAVRLGASIGQFDAGSAAAGSVSLQGGFWHTPTSTIPVPALIYRNGFESP